MLKLKKYQCFFKLFVLSVTILVLTCCSQSTYKVTQITGERIAISSEEGENESIRNYIAPYKNSLEKDLDSILCYNPQVLDKSIGKWQTNIGDWMAQVCFEQANSLLKKRIGSEVDVCLLNHGGIRALLPKGNISTRNAFEIMPFENNLVVLALKGLQIRELSEFFIVERKPHPMYGLEITFDKNNEIKELKIKSRPIKNEMIYYVVTSDYLANGGDRMSFFQNPVKFIDLDYKIRNVLIDEFKSRDTLVIPNQQKIFQLQ